MRVRRFIASFLLLLFASNICAFALPYANQETPSFKILSLRHESTAAVTRIIIEASAPPLYTVFRSTDTQVRVELPGAEGSSLQPSYTVKSPAVDWITVHSQPGNKPRTSIEIAVRPDVRDKSVLNGNTLTIELATDKATPPEARAVEPAMLKPGVTIAKPVEATVSANATRTALRAGVNLPRPADTKNADTLKPATLIRGVRSESANGLARIIVDADGAAQFKAFTLENPFRIVVDINNVKSQSGNQTVAVGVAAVDKVRLGQPSSNVVRIVVDLKNKTAYRVAREGAALVILVGSESVARSEEVKPQTVSPAPQTAEVAKPVSLRPSLPTLDDKSQGEVKVAGQRIDKPGDKPAATDEVIEPTAKTAKLGAQNSAVKPASPAVSKPGVNVTAPPQPAKTENNLAPASKPNVADNRSAPQAKTALAENVTAQVQPKSQPRKETANKLPATVSAANNTTATPGNAAKNTSATVAELQRQSATQPPAALPRQGRVEEAICDPNYVGGLISFDLRAGVDLRDMLRFVSQQYGINFIVDKSVGSVPVDLRMNDLPWNYVLETVLRANRLGSICERGRIIRIAALDAIKEEEVKQQEIAAEKAKQVPLVTKIIHLRYARAAGTLGGGGGASQSTVRISNDSSGGANGRGGLLAIAQNRLSARGRIEVDSRTNSLIVTDLPEYIAAVEDILAKLDKPEPQVEIEARIVVASRNFLRDIGVELAAAAASKGGKIGVFQTSPVQFNPGGGVSPGTNTSGGGSSGGSGSGSGSGSSGQNKGIGPNLLGPFANGGLTANPANTILSLTTGIFGTSIISAALTLNETKGQIRTIASPRVTATDNQPAEIVNGVQIPVQTVSNNTITTTFVTAALRLNIVPQIVEENGEVLMRVVAENNTVNFTLASQSNNGTPGINTQSAESTVRVPDGGTTILGGINIDNEGHTLTRTPGVSRIPVVGELFKRRTTRRDFDEIIFFITPRIIRNDQIVQPGATPPRPLPPLDGRVENVTKPSPKK